MNVQEVLNISKERKVKLKLSIEKIISDEFSGWNFGELEVLDKIENQLSESVSGAPVFNTDLRIKKVSSKIGLRTT